MLLTVKDLSIIYPKNQLASVSQVSLAIARGESLGLVGESGCGKSTLGRSLLQLLPIHTDISGQIILNVDLRRDSEKNLEPKLAIENEINLRNNQTKERNGNWRGEKIALIFQDPMTRLNPLLTIAEHGIEVLRSHQPKITHRQARAKFSETLEAVNIDPSRANQYPHQFSGGMRQRVAIALALLLDPLLLIADEPTTSLDVTVAAEILQELTALRQQRGMGMLLITHDLGLVANYCDRIAVMYAGAIVEVGESAQILDRPNHPYTRNLLNSVIHFDTAVDQVPETLKLERKVLLQVQDLSKSYSRNRFSFPWAKNSTSAQIKAIDRISFELNEGDRFGIIGESGSGKSSTARAILQLIKPDSGSVRFDRVDLTQLKEIEMRKMRSQMQMIFQDPRASLNPLRSIAQAVADPLFIHKLAANWAIAKPKVKQILDRVGIGENLHERLPKELSGGQLQRVAIARALITKPRFLICDEPVSMLDATIQSQILELMLELQQDFQLTYLFITHDLAVARFFCDRLAVMEKGKIVEQGETLQILTQPRHTYTQSLLASIPRW
jgi:peptide/nickel transport system ATP-binding protein